VIDLHLHTTASDGRSTPEELVRDALAAGIHTIAVTDHDTVSALAAVGAAAEAAGLVSVPGIEITAILDARDVHILGYFIDATHPGFLAFLREQRAERRRRIVAIADRLERLGVGIDAATILSERADTGRSPGRPLVAAALVEAGHARSIADAFDRYLSEGRPAFVERSGSPPVDVIARIAAARGVASLAHPGLLKRDDIIPNLADNGLAAIEVFHPDHGKPDLVRYSELARTHRLLVTGGSDYHGPGSGRVEGFGRVGLPAEAYDALVERAAGRRST
jgi:3',5'-nucleoside bisphosphate phosphatase